MKSQPRHAINQRTKLAILQILSELSRNGPIGANFHEVSRALYDRCGRDWDRYADLTGTKTMLPQMEQEGLVRRSETKIGHSRPFFITDAGQQYLDNALKNAVSDESAQRPTWVESMTYDKLENITSDYMGSLPEFRSSSDSRVQALSRDLAKKLFQAQFTSHSR
jgi:hypothetical protein